MRALRILGVLVVWALLATPSNSEGTEDGGGEKSAFDLIGLVGEDGRTEQRPSLAMEERGQLQSRREEPTELSKGKKKKKKCSGCFTILSAKESKDSHRGEIRVKGWKERKKQCRKERRRGGRGECQGGERKDLDETMRPHHRHRHHHHHHRHEPDHRRHHHHQPDILPPPHQPDIRPHQPDILPPPHQPDIRPHQPDIHHQPDILPPPDIPPPPQQPDHHPGPGGAKEEKIRRRSGGRSLIGSTRFGAKKEDLGDGEEETARRKRQTITTKKEKWRPGSGSSISKVEVKEGTARKKRQSRNEKKKKGNKLPGFGSAIASVNNKPIRWN